MSRVIGAATELHKRDNWLYEDVSDISAEEVVRAARRERQRNRTELVIVDYLQLLRRPRRYESVHDSITQTIDVLARAAKHDGLAYLVLSQLSRNVERRDNKRPMLADLRESGSIEERAKCILALIARHGVPIDAAHIFAPPDDLADKAFCGIDRHPARPILRLHPPAHGHGIQQAGVDVS